MAGEPEQPRATWAALPKLVRDLLGAAAFLFFVVYVVVLLLDSDYRSRVEAASQAVGVFATLGAVAVAVLALRQLNLQRRAMEDQRKSFELAALPACGASTRASSVPHSTP